MLISHLASNNRSFRAWGVSKLMNDDTDMPEEGDRVIKIEIDNFHYIQFHLLLG